MSKNPELSIVIPTYNEATYVGRLLSALAKQSFQDFEVIVSDADSNDGIENEIRKFEKKLPLKLVKSPPKGPAYGRNQGAKSTRGRWLLFLDADGDTDDRDFLKILLDETKKNGWNTSSAKMRLRKSESLHNRIGSGIFYRYQKLLAHTNHPVAQGYCILTKKEIFDKTGGFNEKIHYGEDNDYVSRAGSRYGFGFVDGTYYYVDLRRNKDEGFFFPIKNVLHEIYRLTHLNSLENQPFKYEFGKHRKRQ